MSDANMNPEIMPTNVVDLSHYREVSNTLTFDEEQAYRNQTSLPERVKYGAAALLGAGITALAYKQGGLDLKTQSEVVSVSWEGLKASIGATSLVLARHSIWKSADLRSAQRKIARNC